MKSDLMLPCRTLPDLESCLAAPLHAVPTVEYTVRNFELPLNNDDYNFLSQNEINFFATRASDRLGTQSQYSSSRNLTDMTLTFDTPFVLMGLCIYAYGEPYGTAVEGNTFGPQAGVTAAGLPASPLTLRNQAALLAALFAGGVAPDNLVACPAVLDWGGPTWRAIWAFMHAFRLVMKCPSSNYELLLDESLVDIGNCCSQTDYNGFSISKAPHILLSRNINERIDVSTFTSPPNLIPGGAVAGQDPGWFVPVNAEQHADGEIVPYRLSVDFQSMGRPMSEGAVEQWYRLPCPIPMTPSTKVKITLNKAEGDEPYFDRLLQEMSMRRCEYPVNADLGCNFPIDEDGQDRDVDGGIGCYTNIPGGHMRIGVGLKGFQVRGGVCDQLMTMIEGKSFSQIATQYPGLVSPGGVVRSGAAQQVCFPVGALGDPKEGGR